MTPQALDPTQIGPGFAGFLVMFFLALAVVVLIRSMVGHLRKVRYSPDPAAEPAAAPTSPQPGPRQDDRPTA